MNRINFSHVYPKLHGQIAAQLLKVEVHDRKELDEDFVEYDTVYAIPGVFVERKGDECDFELEKGHFPLPSGKLLILVFLGDKLIPFTTVRRWTPMKNADGLNKEEWYRSKIGELFEIAITREAADGKR